MYQNVLNYSIASTGSLSSSHRSGAQKRWGIPLLTRRLTFASRTLPLDRWRRITPRRSRTVMKRGCNQFNHQNWYQLVPRMTAWGCWMVTLKLHQISTPGRHQVVIHVMKTWASSWKIPHLLYFDDIWWLFSQFLRKFIAKPQQFASNLAGEGLPCHCSDFTEKLNQAKYSKMPRTTNKHWSLMGFNGHQPRKLCFLVIFNELPSGDLLHRHGQAPLKVDYFPTKIGDQPTNQPTNQPLFGEVSSPFGNFRKFGQPKRIAW